mmetsp:Transcript_10669/g.15862  ORF Transcript_10669/g.15862 Transcript_10669/m.15862 type:complete len:125 (+) Transcript_10669:327-701(+)
MFAEVINRREATSVSNEKMCQHNDKNVFFLYKPTSDFSLPKAHSSLTTVEQTSTSNFSKMILLILFEIAVFPFFCRVYMRSLVSAIYFLPKAGASLQQCKNRNTNDSREDVANQMLVVMHMASG